jgi:hypothetical protein
MYAIAQGLCGRRLRGLGGDPAAANSPTLRRAIAPPRATRRSTPRAWANRISGGSVCAGATLSHDFRTSTLRQADAREL